MVPKNVLDWVNEGRKILDLPALNDLPKGLVGCAGECPLANAFLDSGLYPIAGVGKILFYDSSDFSKKAVVTVEYPDYVYRWVSDFDSGKYREYRL